MVSSTHDRIALWSITPNGKVLADAIYQRIPAVDLFCSERLKPESEAHVVLFRSLSTAVRKEFHNYRGHIFFMSTGIVVRLIAPLIRSKMLDPAVVVVDDRGRNAVSLLSGHIGGANELTDKIARILGANAVITTATDVNRTAAIDMLAKEKNLSIENPSAIKAINMALLIGQAVYVHDPFDRLGNKLPNSLAWAADDLNKNVDKNRQEKRNQEIPAVYIDDVKRELPANVLILRPCSLVAGIGCNRNTGMEEMHTLLQSVLERYHLASASLNSIASIDMKADESGLIELARYLGLPLSLYSREELEKVRQIKNPSPVVEKHVGVKSVCEAAAILAARNGPLIVPKQSNKNVTVAVARINFLF
jgi:cobalt-precorrin 5A hydrolase